MLRWWYVLLISEFHRFQARSVIDETLCTVKSAAVIPDHCILKCVQLLYDYKFCTICENEEAFVYKRKLEWCSACESDQWQRNSTQYELYRRIAIFFNALEVSWCNDALHLNEYVNAKELNRTKRYNPGIGGAHARPYNSYSATYSETSMMMGMIIFGIFLLCALGFLCKSIAKNLGPQENYEINS